MNSVEAFDFDNSETIGRRFLWFRTYFELSPEALAEELDRPVNFIYDVERGKQVPDLPMLVYLEKTYGLDCNWLLTGHGQFISRHGNKGGLPPGEVKDFLKRAGIPFRGEKEYSELLTLLQVPEVWTMIVGCLGETAILFRRDIRSKMKEFKIHFKEKTNDIKHDRCGINARKRRPGDPAC